MLLRHSLTTRVTTKNSIHSTYRRRLLVDSQTRRVSTVPSSPPLLLDSLAIQFNVSIQKDWRYITYSNFFQHPTGYLLLSRNEWSPHSVLVSTYCYFNWKLQQNFNHTTSQYWKKRKNKSLFLDKLASILQIETIFQFDLIKKDVVKDYGGSGLFKYHSMDDLLGVVYPELKLMPNRFSLSHWKSSMNQQLFLEHMARKLNIKTVSDWYPHHYSTFERLKGLSLLYLYQQRHQQDNQETSFLLLSSIYPELKFFFFQSQRIPMERWTPSNQRLFLDLIPQLLSKHHGVDSITQFSCWYQIPIRLLGSIGAYSFFQSLHPNFPSALLQIYSEYKWKLIDFSSIKCNELFKHAEAVTGSLTRTFDLLRITDWYRISNQQVESTLGKRIDKWKIIEMIHKAFPEEQLVKTEFSKLNKKSTQRLLKIRLQELFPSAEIIEEYRHPLIKRETGIALEFDVFIETLGLAFEYHGEQHYRDIPMAGFAGIAETTERDTEKQKLCDSHGIKLVVVPFWWDHSTKQLKWYLLLLLYNTKSLLRLLS